MSDVTSQEDLSTMDWILLACCPVDRSKLPQGPELDAIVITDLYTIMTCMNANCEFGSLIWVGPRQLETYKQYEDKTLLCCYVCAILAQEQLGTRPGENMTTLGGGYPAEGSPRHG